MVAVVEGNTKRCFDGVKEVVGFGFGVGIGVY